MESGSVPENDGVRRVFLETVKLSSRQLQSTFPNVALLLDALERVIEDRAVNASTTLNSAGGEARVEPTSPADASESLTAPLPAHTLLRQHLLAPAPQYNDWDEV